MQRKNVIPHTISTGKIINKIYQEWKGELQFASHESFIPLYWYCSFIADSNVLLTEILTTEI
jgi:hypothetical protein